MGSKTKLLGVGIGLLDDDRREQVLNIYSSIKFIVPSKV